MLKKYDELTDEQKKKVTVMYSDQTTVQMYLYNFDEHGNYHGRQSIPVGAYYTPKEVKDYVEEKKEELPEKFIDTEPVRKVKRTPKKK